MFAPVAALRGPTTRSNTQMKRLPPARRNCRVGEAPDELEQAPMPAAERGISRSGRPETLLRRTARRTARASALAGLLLAAIGAIGLRPAIADQEPGWHYELTLYGWVPSFSGTVGDASGSLDIDLVEFQSDSLIEQTNFAFFGAAKVRRDDFFVFGDLVYADLSDEGLTRGSVIDKVDAEITAASAIGGAGYTFTRWEGGSADALLGLRYVTVDATLKVSRGEGAVKASGDLDWFEPAIGVGARQDLSERWYLEGTAFIGGFGLGSEFTSDLYAAAGYRLTDWAALIGGYRWLSIDYDDEIPIDVDLYGPLLGATLSF
jgi:hypothetical protein